MSEITNYESRIGDIECEIWELKKEADKVLKEISDSEWGDGADEFLYGRMELQTEMASGVLEMMSEKYAELKELRVKLDEQQEYEKDPYGHDNPGYGVGR